MFNKIVNLLFSNTSKEAMLLNKLKEAEKEIETLKQHKAFSESIFYYSGNYPAWKARLEFHDLLREEASTSRINDFDSYLKRVEEGLLELAELDSIDETKRESWLFARQETDSLALSTTDILKAIPTTKGG